MGARGGRMAGGSLARADQPLLSFSELRAAVENVGQERYHHRHPFHLLMHAGKLTRGQLQAWVLNRYYYQSMIPVKDAAIVSRSDQPEFRRAWRQRISQHDGDGRNPGGIERWLELAEAAGLRRERVQEGREILPATRYAVHEYLNLARTRPLVEAVAASLTELFSGQLIALRIQKLREHYPWLQAGLRYFENRLSEAPEDARFALDYVYQNAGSRLEQEHAIQAVRDKCDILWAQLDGLYFAYVEPGWPPPGSFRIESERGAD